MREGVASQWTVVLTCVCIFGERKVRQKCMARLQGDYGIGHPDIGTIGLINPTEGSGCGPQYFTCENGECIPFYWRCDAIIDCSDASDENCTSKLYVKYIDC